MLIIGTISGFIPKVHDEIVCISRGGPIGAIAIFEVRSFLFC